VLFPTIVQGFNNITDVKRVFTMTITENWGAEWLSAYQTSVDQDIIKRFKLYFRNKFINSHPTPEVRRIIFAPTLYNENFIFWTSYADAEATQLAQQTFDIHKFNSFPWEGPSPSPTFQWQVVANTTTIGPITTPMPIFPLPTSTPSILPNASPQTISSIHLTALGVLLIMICADAWLQF
jgi:hypothetical protein